MSGFTVKRDSGLFIGDVDNSPASGTIDITENGTDIDVARYAKANVNVPQPSGKINITENGTDIDVAEYAVADVDVGAQEILQTTFKSTHIGGGGSGYGIKREVTSIAGNGDYYITLPRADGFGNELNIIGQEAFANNNIVTRIRVEPSAHYSYVNENAFKNCNNLKYIELPDVWSLSQYAFANTSALMWAVLPSYTKVSEKCFEYSGIYEFQCQSIDTYGFAYCDRLSTVKIEGDHNYDVLPEIDAFAFHYCTSLQTILLGSKILNASPKVKLNNQSLQIKSDDSYTLENLVILGTSIISCDTNVCGTTTLSINNVYYGGSETDFNNWLLTLNDPTFVSILTAATKHYNYNNSGSEFFISGGPYNA